jgi:hypothetical protein
VPQSADKLFKVTLSVPWVGQKQASWQAFFAWRSRQQTPHPIIRRREEEDVCGFSSARALVLLDDMPMP